MPANLTPEYFKAEKWFRSATTNDEKILALERMLSVMPKHKGTDHLKADLRRKLSKLKEASTQKKHGSQVDVFHVPRSGAGQIILLGMPNSGKSSIVGMLSNAKVNIAEFPYATGAPVPGMVQYEDVQIQLVDMPPITADFVAPGQVGTYRNCDLICIVIDLSQDIAEQVQVLMDFLDSRSLIKNEQTPAYDHQGNILGREAFVLCTKADIATDGALEKVKELLAKDFEIFTVSTESTEGIEEFPKFLFDKLKVIRIYAKPPGQPPDMGEPFTLPAGSTVSDLAAAIHRQLAQKLQSARAWGTNVYDGQNVHLSHVLNDKDIIELHFN